MASLTDFISAVRSEAAALDNRNNSEDNISLGEIFIDSIHLALHDIKCGADSDDFRDLAVANFLISSARENLPTEDVAIFVRSLSNSDSFRESASMADAPVSDFSEGLPSLDSFSEFPQPVALTSLPSLNALNGIPEPLPPLD